MLKTGRLYRANCQQAQGTQNPTAAKKSYLPAFLREKRQDPPVMVVATIK